MLPLDHQGKRRGLHTAYRKHSASQAVLDGVQPRGVQAEYPVADGAAQSGSIQRFQVFMLTEMGESILYRVVGQRRNPQTLHRLSAFGLLHHPPLYKLTLLSGIAAVDDFVGLLNQRFYDAELAFYARVLNQLYAEPVRNHRKRPECPSFPFGTVVVRLLKCAEMAESPRNAVASAFIITVATTRRPQYGGDVFPYRRLLRDTEYHKPLFLASSQIASISASDMSFMLLPRRFDSDSR